MFVYSKPQVAAFGMTNTFIPLDVPFIAENGRIVYIHPNATPQSEASITMPQPVKAVLEINGGLAARLGDRVATSPDARRSTTPRRRKPVGFNGGRIERGGASARRRRRFPAPCGR